MNTLFVHEILLQSIPVNFNLSVPEKMFEINEDWNYRSTAVFQSLWHKVARLWYEVMVPVIEIKDNGKISYNVATVSGVGWVADNVAAERHRASRLHVKPLRHRQARNRNGVTAEERRHKPLKL